MIGQMLSAEFQATGSFKNSFNYKIRIRKEKAFNKKTAPTNWPKCAGRVIDQFDVVFATSARLVLLKIHLQEVDHNLLSMMKRITMCNFQELNLDLDL